MQKQKNQNNPDEFYVSEIRLKIMASIYTIWGVTMLIFSPKIVVFAIFCVPFICLGILFFFISNKILQLEITDTEILFHPKTGFGRIRIQDFYQLYLSPKMNSLPISELSKVEYEESFLDGRKIVLTTKYLDEIELLLIGNEKTFEKIDSRIEELIQNNINH